MKILCAFFALLIYIGVALAGPLPNSQLTPGALNSHVTQANIDSTICGPTHRPGLKKTWIQSLRPSSDFTNKLKKEQLNAQGYADQKTRDYEEDHLISIELGGAPANPKNLWPEPYAGRWGARTKDQLEDKLHRLVCAGKLSLAAAQHALSTNWIAAYTKYVGGVTDDSKQNTWSAVGPARVGRRRRRDARRARHHR